MQHSDLILRNAAAFLDLGDETRGASDLLVKDGMIAAIGVALPAAPGSREIDCSRRLVAPGLVNAHWHSPMQSAHGTSDRLDHKRYMWLNQADTANRTADDIVTSALLGCIQMIRSGTTSVIDHFPEQGFDCDDVSAVVDALERSGMRAVVALRIFDGEYSDIMPDEEQATAPLIAAISQFNPLTPISLEASMTLVEQAIVKFDRRAGRIRIFPAPSNPIRCSDEFLIACQKLSEKYDTGIHCHLLETQRQAEIAQIRHGQTIVAHMLSLGVFDERWSCAHCNWLTETDIELMAACGAVATLNPESNLKLGSGVPPIPKLIRAGVTCAMGTDGASTNDNLVLQDAMQLCAILHRVAEPDRSCWVGAEDVIRMATLGGAAAMLEPRLGRIAVGQKADIVLYDLDEPCWVPLNDPIQQFVFGERGGSVRTVIIDGHLVMDEGRIVTFDETAVLKAASDLLTRSRSRNADIGSIAEAFKS